MNDKSRRDFLRTGSIGLAAMGLGTLALRNGVGPTPSSGDGIAYAGIEPVPTLGGVQTFPGALTAANIKGPFYRKDVPFRAKITPPFEPGTVLVVRGRVWGHDTKKPLAGAVIDIWQANAKGRYDNDDPESQPAKGFFANRGRLVTDETGYYEYETIHPGRYPLDETRLRPAHIHYWVRQAGYHDLVTQLYFNGDKYNEGDPFIKSSLIMTPKLGSVNGQNYEIGTFDVVLQEE